MTTPALQPRPTVTRAPRPCAYLTAVDEIGLLACSVIRLHGGGSGEDLWRIHVFRPDRHDPQSGRPWTTLHVRDAGFPDAGGDVDAVLERVRGLLLAHAEGYGVFDGVSSEAALALAAR